MDQYTPQYKCQKLKNVKEAAESVLCDKHVEVVDITVQDKQSWQGRIYYWGNRGSCLGHIRPTSSIVYCLLSKKYLVVLHDIAQ